MMTKLEWSAGLATGIAPIDDQHRGWIDNYNHVADAVAGGTGGAEVSRTLSFLIDYTVMHFSTEEKYMTDYEYPGLADHKAKHESLILTLSGLIDDFHEDGASDVVSKALDTFLGNWLIKHINEVDMQFSAFLQEKGIEIP